MKDLLSLEDLIITPSELHNCVYENPKAPVLKLFPPPILYPVAPFTRDEDQECKVASPAEMRRYKSNGLRMDEEKERKETVGEDE